MNGVMNRAKGVKMRKVLVVDDDQKMLKQFRNIILKSGYQVIACESAEEAIQHIEDVDAVITDFSMPKMDGNEFAKVVKLKRHEVPVMIATSNPDIVPKDHLANSVICKLDAFWGDVNCVSWLKEVLGE